MDMDALANKGRALIDDILYLTLSTSSPEGVPWCSPVNTAFDNDYNFYWGSARDTRHSVNIRQNSRCCAVIYNSALAEGQGTAVYMDGHAYELRPDTWMEGLHLLRARSGDPDKYVPLDYYSALRDVRIYNFRPDRFYMLLPGGDPRFDTFAACRVEVDIRRQGLGHA